MCPLHPKYPHGVITERAKPVKGKIKAMVIKKLLKNKKPSPTAMRDVIPRGSKSECRSTAMEGSHQRCLA